MTVEGAECGIYVSITSGGKNTMYRCQQNLMSMDKHLKAILELICAESHKLTNCGIYYARQLYLKTQKIIGKFDLEKEYKNNKHDQVLSSQAAQQILRSVAESFKSFKELNQKYRKGMSLIYLNT